MRHPSHLLISTGCGVFLASVFLCTCWFRRVTAQAHPSKSTGGVAPPPVDFDGLRRQQVNTFGNFVALHVSSSSSSSSIRHLACRCSCRLERGFFCKECEQMPVHCSCCLIVCVVGLSSLFLFGFEHASTQLSWLHCFSACELCSAGA